jgi:hypothetical protein
MELAGRYYNRLGALRALLVDVDEDAFGVEAVHLDEAVRVRVRRRPTP